MTARQEPSPAPTPSVPRDGLLRALRRLYGHLSRRRRFQLAALFILVLIGALAELMTIGAVLPFLALMADPARAAHMPVLGPIFTSLGWQAEDFLVPATLLFAIVALVAGMVRILLTWSSQKFVFRLGHDIGREVYRRTLYQPYAWHTARNSSLVISDINKVQAVVGASFLPLMQTLSATIIATFILTALIAVNATVALTAAAGFGALYLSILLASRTRLRTNSFVISQAQTQCIKSVQEGLGGIRDVLINHTQSVYLDTYTRADLIFRDAQAQNAFIGMAPRFVIEGMGMVLIAFMALILARSEGGLATALPVLGALALGAVRLLPLLQVMYFGSVQVMGNRQNLLDVLNVLALPLPDESVRQKEATPLPFSRAITLEKIGFGYQAGRPTVLTDINLTIPRGSRIGIIGKTGSGKSTLGDLIMGLLSPTSGLIRIDDVPLTAANLKNWQAHIAHVPQAIYLSDASLAENIAFGVLPERIDHARIVAAARQAALAEFVDSLPNGYDTFVGERGVRLSGGQRQRVGIARALYRNADVLVFDEATSALDSETETAVMDAVNSLDRELTILIIAHRLSTLEGCDSVIRLEKGAAHVMPAAPLIHAPADARPISHAGAARIPPSAARPGF